MEQGTLFNQTVAQSLLASERSEEVSIMIIHIIILITKPFTMTKTLLHVPVNSLPMLLLLLSRFSHVRLCTTP